MTAVTIPNSVTSIGVGAFYYCSGLTSVTIPNSVTSIGRGAFAYCSGLTSVTIPNSVTSIGDEAFIDCTSLKSVTIESDSIMSKAYTFNSNLENIFGSQVTEYIIGDEVTSIGDYAFYKCTGLTSVTIPNSVTSIGDKAFSGCSSLTSVTIPNSVTSIGEWAFGGCSGLTSVTIPNSVTSIGSYAFQNCSGLTSVTIPNSVTSIGEGAFYLCSGLTSPVYNAHVFAFMPTSYSGAYTIPDGIESIAGGAFAECTGLTSVTIPNSVTSIGDKAFSGCSSLTSVTIPNSVTSIGDYAFYDCYSLSSVTIPNSVTSIGDWAFYDCKSLSSIYNYATSPQVIDNSVFYGEEVEYEGIQYYGPVDKSICKLYVPAGSIDLYKAAEGWKDFTNIQAIVCSVSLVCDSVRGSIEGDSGEFDYLSQLTYTAVPNEGYYFIQWSDGVTDNPRTIELTQDTILTALFDSIPAGQDTTATEIKNDSVAVSATPTEDNGVTLEWPAVEGADTYTIAIYKNDELICTLVFDAEGHLISIRFAAPAHEGNGRNIPVAEQAANGWRYVVNGLEGNATYTYSVVAKDENGNVLLSESIDFTMPVPLSVDNIDSSSLQGGDRGRLILYNGQLLILRGDKVYTLQGQEVK